MRIRRGDWNTKVRRRTLRPPWHLLTLTLPQRPRATPTPSSGNTARSGWLPMVRACDLKSASTHISLPLAADGAGAAPATKRPNVQMPDEYLPPNKILFLQNLPETVTKDQLMALFSQYPNLHEVRLIPTKKDIAFVEYLDEASATVAKDALHNYKLDGENKIKVCSTLRWREVCTCADHNCSRSPSQGSSFCCFGRSPSGALLSLLLYCPCIPPRARIVY